MKITPKLVHRDAQRYAAIRRTVQMKELGKVLPPLHGDVGHWLAAKGVKPSGPPFWRYLVVDMKKELQVDVAFPVSSLISGDDAVVADVLPAGRYATVLHVGHPDGLQQATAALLTWAEQNGIQWQMEGEKWGGRIEWYLSDPRTEPDMNKWKTELAFLTSLSP